MDYIITELNGRLSYKLKNTIIECPECEDVKLNDPDYHCTFCEDWSDAYDLIKMKLRDAITRGHEAKHIDDNSIEKWINDNI